MLYDAAASSVCCSFLALLAKQEEGQRDLDLVALLRQISGKAATDMTCNTDEQIGAALAPQAEDSHGSVCVSTTPSSHWLGARLFTRPSSSG